MAVSTTDAALLRSARHRVALTLNAVPLVVVGTAQINQATFSYPCAEFTVDTTSTDWLTLVQVGMAFSVGTTPGGSEITWGVVRKAPSGSTFYPDAKSLGDAGYASDIRLGYGENQYVTVYAHRPLWSVLPRLANKVFYKQHDLAYSDQGSSPAPVCNIGQHRQAWLGLTDGVEDTTTQLTFSAANSFAWGSKTLSGYAWVVEDYEGGASSFVGGSTTEDVTIEFSAGFYIVSCTLTDSASKTHTASRYVWVNDRAGNYPSFGDTYAFTIGSDAQDRIGRRVGLTIHGDVTTDELYPGQFFLLSEAAYYNRETLTDDTVRVRSFAGYAPDVNTTRELKTGRIELALDSPMHYARRLGAASQYIIEKASPANWTEFTSALSHPAGALWYLFQHHAPAFFAMHDYVFDAGVATLRRQVFKFDGATSIGSQVDKLQDMGLGVAGSKSDGTTAFRSNALYMDNDDRNNLDILFTWNETDIQPPLTMPVNFTMPSGVVRGYAFSYAGGSAATPFASRAPGATQGQGAGQSDFTFTVTASEGQTRVNEVTGHRFAIENGRTQPFTTKPLGNMDIVEPVEVSTWNVINVPATYDPLGVGLSNVRVIPIRVTRQWKLSERGSIVKAVEIEWQRETFGQPGITVPVDRGGAENWISQVQIPVDYDPKFLNNFAIAWNTDGDIVRSLNFNSATPHFEDIGTGLVGVVNDFAPDYASEFFSDGIGAIGGWVVTTAGTALYVYYAPDIRTGLPVWTLQDTETMADSTVSGTARIGTSKTNYDFVVAAWRSQTGTRVVRSTDAGGTWGSPVTVGDTATDTGNDNAELGFAIDGVNQLVTARHTDGDYYLYLATSTGGSFSQVTGSPANGAPYALITVDGQGSAYIEAGGYTAPPEPTGMLVTFDTGGYEDYALDVLTEITTGGNTGNCIHRVAPPGNNGFVSVEVTPPEIISGDIFGYTVEFDFYTSWTGTPNALDRVRPSVSVFDGVISEGDYTSDDFYPYASPGNNGVWLHTSYVFTAHHGADWDQFRARTTLVKSVGSGATYEIKMDNIQITPPE